MSRRVAKELLHIREWLSLADDLVMRGRDAYAADGLLQEAGDSLMMKLGEAAGRLARAEVEPPSGMAWTMRSPTDPGSSISTRSTARSPGSPCRATAP